MKTDRVNLVYGIGFVLGLVLWARAIPVTQAANFNPLPDTGQSICYDLQGHEMTCPEQGEELFGQDGNYWGSQPFFTHDVVGGDEIVIDSNTGLMWQQDTADTNGDAIVDEDDRLDQQSAVDFCDSLEFAGHSDWRLPTIFELTTIMNFNHFAPVIDSSIFSCEADYYWSFTWFAGDLFSAWAVDFNHGADHWYDQEETFYVRCVRDN